MEKELWQKLKQRVKFEPVTHYGENRIKLVFPYDWELVELVKTIPEARWSKTLCCWHIPEEIVNPNAIKSYIVENSNDINNLSLSKAKEVNSIITKYIDNLTLQNYSKRTIEIYVPFFKSFLLKFADENIPDLDYGKIRHYVSSRIFNERLSETVIKQIISSIKYYYEKVLQRPKLYFFIKDKTVIIKKPVKFLYPELDKILWRISNLKDKAIILLLYYFEYSPLQLSVLTISELKKKLILTTSLNSKERNAVRKLLNNYFVEYKPQCYIIEKSASANYKESELKYLIQLIIQKYKLIEIYSREYEDAIKQTMYSDETKRVYKSMFQIFIKSLNYKNPEDITEEEIRRVLVALLRDNKSASTQNQYINSIKFYYENVLQRKLGYEATLRARKPKQLPGVLSEEEIEKIINSIVNLKHKCIIYLLYSAGLRRSELQKLTINDIDSKRGIIIVKQGKGRKDRTTLLSDQLLDLLRLYYKEFKPKYFLFEGISGKEYSFASMSKILKDAIARVSIKRRVSLHMLRHSFATHLLEHGTDIRYIQAILGHNNLKTTQVYTHISKTKTEKILSPGDRLKIH